MNEKRMSNKEGNIETKDRKSVTNELSETLKKNLILQEKLDKMEKEMEKIKEEKEKENPQERRNLKRFSNKTMSGYQELITEFKELKEKHNQLITESKQIEDGAIDILVEKEKVIMKLEEKLKFTENFYKEQFENNYEKINNLQKKVEYYENDYMLNKNELNEIQRNEKERFLETIDNLNEEIKRLEMKIIEEKQKNEDYCNRVILERYNEMQNTYKTAEKELYEKFDHVSNYENNFDEEIYKKKIEDLENEKNKMKEIYTNENAELKKLHEEIINKKNYEIKHVRLENEKNIKNLENEWMKKLTNKINENKNISENNEKLMKQNFDQEEEIRNLLQINLSLKETAKEFENYKKQISDWINSLSEKHESKISILENKYKFEKSLIQSELDELKESIKKKNEEINTSESSKSSSTSRKSEPGYKYKKKSVFFKNSKTHTHVRSSSLFQDITESQIKAKTMTMTSSFMPLNRKKSKSIYTFNYGIDYTDFDDDKKENEEADDDKLKNKDEKNEKKNIQFVENIDYLEDEVVSERYSNKSEEKIEKKMENKEVQVNLNIKSIGLFINNLEKVIRDNVLIDLEEYLNKIKTLYSKSYDIGQGIDSQYKILICNLVQKTIVKINSKTLPILNHFKLIFIRVLGYSIENKIIVYNAELIDEIQGKFWSFDIKYSELASFHSHLKSNVPKNLIHKIPEFPKRIWFYQTGKSFIEKQKLEIDFYLKKILSTECEEIVDFSNISEFLNIKITQKIDNDSNSEKIKSWENLIFHIKKNKNKEITFEILNQLIQFFKNEMKLLTWKYSKIKRDIELVDQNDAFILMNYEELRNEELKNMNKNENTENIEKI